MNYLLAIIDLQEGFYPNNRRHLLEVKGEVEEAKRAKTPIMLVEMMKCGDSIPFITKLVDRYPNLIKVKKRDTGGGREMIAAMKNLSIDPLTIRVCGLYTNCCIADTVGELARKKRWMIEIAEKACIGTTRSMHSLGIKELLQYKNVRLK